jgi:hypothetical protein
MKVESRVTAIAVALVPGSIAALSQIAAPTLRVGTRVRVFADTNREHLLQYIGGGPIGHHGGEVRLNPVQFRC